MERATSTFLRWAGRILILLAALVLVASLFLPDAVQPLNPIVCPNGTELDNSRYTPPRAPDDEKLVAFFEPLGFKLILREMGSAAAAARARRPARRGTASPSRRLHW